MGTNPEGSRDHGRNSDDAPSRPLSAVPPGPPAPTTQPGAAPTPAGGTQPGTPPTPKGNTQPAVLLPPSVTHNSAPDSLGARGWQSITGLMEQDAQAEDEDEQEGERDGENEVGEVDYNDDDPEDERTTATPTSFDGSRPSLPDPDEVLIHMTNFGDSQPGRKSQPPDGTVVEGSSSADGEEGSSKSGSGSMHPRRDALFGQVLADRYRVLDLIGKGGMGKVYLAEHVALGKRVAVKVLNPAYTHRPDQVKRFLREAQAASTIGHENVIDITDFGEMPNGSVFFAMEHLQGEDLGKLLKRGPLQWSRARRILLQICRALQAAHAKGIIHRDMKPENCFIIHRNGMRDFVKVLDFGIAKFLEENRQVSHTLTQAGALIGTPEYMAPEQVQGEAADSRMDIYALGCIMYQLLTGQLPFSDKTMFGVLSQQVNVRPVPPKQLAPEADIPPEVEAIILKAMEKDRALRFQSMAELIEAIVAAPRGTSDRMGTTSNLDAAASAARIAAAMNAASANALAAATTPATPQDVSFNHISGPISSMGLPATTASAGHWPEVARDPQLLTKLVIGLGAAVCMLLIGLVCALNRGGEVTDADPSVIRHALAQAAALPKRATPVVTPPVPVPEPPGDTADVIVDDEEPTPKKDPGTRDPGGKDPVTPPIKKTTPKKDARKDRGTDPQPEPTLLELAPRDRGQALAPYSKDVEACRASNSAARGSVANVKFLVEGSSGKILEATPQDTSAAARCIAKVIKAKVRFPRFKSRTQEFNFRFQM